MGFRGQEFAFDSPAAAVDALAARLRAWPTPPEVDTVDLGVHAPASLVGRLLAEDVRTDRESPAFDQSVMDGYAVRASSIVEACAAGPLVVPIAGECRIGRVPPRLADGRCALRISTGAALPPGADAVIRREDVIEHAATLEGKRLSANEAEPGSIEVPSRIALSIASGQNIRGRGENAGAGVVALRGGEWLSAGAVGTIAMVGLARLHLYRRVRVAVITTGDELVAPTQTPSPFQLRNSNGPALDAILGSHRWLTIAGYRHAPDDDELETMLRDALVDSDAVVLTGGVSMGHRDPVRGAVDSLGADIIFHGLPQRPGKPMLAAILARAASPRPVPIFGLPGNPVSALVTCSRIVLPVLAVLAGAARTPPDCLPRFVKIANPDGRTLDLWWHRLARLVVDPAGVPHAELVDARSSGDIVAAGRSDGFVEVPPSVSPGVVSFYAWPAH